MWAPWPSAMWSHVTLKTNSVEGISHWNVFHSLSIHIARFARCPENVVVLQNIGKIQYLLIYLWRWLAR